MHLFHYSLPIRITVLSALLAAAPGLLIANDGVMPPPQASEQSASLDRIVEKNQSLPNLRDELMPNDDSAVDIRSYQRKDGTTVTEYGAKGQVFRLKVQPPGGLPAYYLERNADGRFERRLTGNSTRITPPSWILQEF